MVIRNSFDHPAEKRLPAGDGLLFTHQRLSEKVRAW